MTITITPNQLTNSETVLKMLCELGQDCCTAFQAKHPDLKELIIELQFIPSFSEQTNMSHFALSENENVLHLFVKFIPMNDAGACATFLSKEIEEIKRKLIYEESHR